MTGDSTHGERVPAVADVARALPRRIDFNSILAVLNPLIAIATLIAYDQVGANAYLDGETILLAMLLAVQTQFALYIERRRREPFVILVTFTLILYYSLRILTLLLVPVSYVMDRFEYLPRDSSSALRFMLVANLFLYSGLFARRAPVNDGNGQRAWSARKPMRVLAIVVLAMIAIYSRGTFWSVDDLPRGLVFLVMFFAQSFIFLMSLTYFVVFHRTLTSGFRVALLLLLALEMVLHTLAGSRSAFVGIFQNVLIVCLAFGTVLRIPRRGVVLGVVASPFVVAALVAAFVLSTFTRTFGGSSGTTLSTALEAAQTAGDRFTKDNVLESGLPIVLARAGFFDYVAEVVAHRRQYQGVINFPAYTRSITDNLLTPGFDLFDQPKISNSLRFAYEDLGQPSKIISADEYQSDQLGIYGEWYVLLGYASLPVFYLIGSLTKRIYTSIDDADPFLRTIKRVIVMTLFVETLNSFGFDWVIMDIVPLLVSYYVYRGFFPTRMEVQAPAAAS
jgi:hypothetical protein